MQKINHNVVYATKLYQEYVVRGIEMSLITIAANKLDEGQTAYKLLLENSSTLKNIIIISLQKNINLLSLVVAGDWFFL